MKKMVSRARELMWPFVAGLIVLLIGTTSALVTSQIERVRIEKQAVEDTKVFADHFFSDLQLLIDPAEKATESLATLVRSRDVDFTTPENQWYLEQLAEDTQYWRNLSVAPDNCISAVAPRAGNEGALGYCLTSNPSEALNVQNIMDYKQPRFFGPIQLAQDAQGFIYDYPVFLQDGSYWGMVTGVLDSSSFVAPLMQVANESDMSVSLCISKRDGDTSEKLIDNLDTNQPFQQNFTFEDVGATFLLTAAPTVVNYGTANQFFWRIFIGASLLGITSGLVVYNFRRQGATRRKLEMITKKSPSVLFQLKFQEGDRFGLEYISEGSRQVLGLSPEEIGLSPDLLIARLDKRDRDAASARLRSAKSPGEIWSQRMRYEHPSSGARWLQVEAIYERPTGSSGEWSGVFVDVTSTAEQEHLLSISAGVFSALNEGVAILDTDWRVLEINPGITKYTGYQKSELLGQDFFGFSAGLNAEALNTVIRSAIEQQGYWRGEVVNRHKSGRISKDMLTFSSVVNNDGELSQIIVVMNSIEKLMIDSVTGLPNRTNFEEHLAQSIELVEDSEESLALFEIAITGVGAVNDSFGYKIGDLLLHEIGGRLSEFSGDTRNIGRVGDTTFALIVNFDGDQTRLEELSYQILESLAAPFVFEDVSVLVMTTIGIAVLSPESQNVEELRSHAGQACKVALDEGGTGFLFFTPKMETGAKVRSYLTSDLQEAIKDHSLSFFYQPIVRVSDRKIVKAEALARWFDEHLGEVSPARFIPLAEESGLIHDLGLQLFEDCINTSRELQQLGRPISISLNVSPVEIMSINFQHDQLIAQAVSQGLDASNIVFELTEGILLNRRELIEQRISACRELGIQFAIDDFGTGYSSLSYLQQLEVDYIKIDKSFIDKIETEEGYALCRSIIELAHALSLELIAEGVETENQFELLKHLGCEYAQGYLFSRALPKPAFLELLGFKQG